MACTPGQVSELPGSDVACNSINVRECLMLRGEDITTVIGTVQTDGVVIVGDGSAGSPVTLGGVRHDETLTGFGTLASPLSVNAAGAVHVDPTSIEGSGTLATPYVAVTLRGSGGVIDATNTGFAFGMDGTTDAVVGSTKTITIDGNVVNILTRPGEATQVITAQAGEDVTLGVGAAGAVMNLGAGAHALQAYLDDNSHSMRFGINRTVPSVALSVGGVATACAQQFTDGSTVPVAPAGAGRFRWNDGLNRWEWSGNGSAWAAVTPGGGGSSVFYDANIAKVFALGNFGQSDNINLGALGQNTLVRCDTSGQRSGTYTGFSGGVDGKIVTLLRQDVDTSMAQTIAYENASSVAANRITLRGLANAGWYPMQALTFLYVGALSRWLLISNS